MVVEPVWHWGGRCPAVQNARSSRQQGCPGHVPPAQHCPSPRDLSPTERGVSAQLLNKELGKSSFCVKTKWRFSAF